MPSGDVPPCVSTMTYGIHHLCEGAGAILVHVSTTQGWDDGRNDNCDEGAKNRQGRRFQLRNTNTYA